MSHADKGYYERRAESEIELAQSATDEREVRIHYELACAYLDIIYPARDPSKDDRGA